MKTHNRLKELYTQKKKIEEEIKLLESSLEKDENKELSKDKKIEVFKELFITREDIFAKKWLSKDTKKEGFYPVSKSFRGSDFIPISNKDIELHLRGQIQIASYLINENNRSKYIIFELLQKDIKSIQKSLDSININGLYEFTSYNSIYLWIFFEEEIETKNAKNFAEYILRKSNISAKIYPSREFSTNASLGDFVELPLHWNYRNQNRTVFFDEKNGTVFPNQWKILQNIKKVPTKEVLKYITFADVNRSNLILDDVELPTFKLDIKLYDFIYIPTLNLSKSFINKLKSFASFDNPQIKILLSLRKPIYNTPRVIKNFDEDDTYLKLPRGLVYELEEYLLDNNISFVIENKTFFQRIDTMKVKFELRDEQKTAIEKINQSNFSICVAPPGFGKTLIGAKMFELRYCNTLIIVNKNMLLDQWIDRFIDYFGYTKKDIGYLGKSENKLNGKIDIATMQSLKNNPDIINNYSFVIVDECHHIPAVTFEQIVKKFFGKYILGLSATPNRKDGLEPILFQQLGRVSYEYKKKKTVNNKLEIIKTDFISQSDNYATLINELCIDEKRNTLIINKIKQYKDRKILVLTDRIEHINLLEKQLKKEEIIHVSIHGSMNKKEQNEKMALVKSNNLILATTSYFGEGIDFPHLNTIMFVTPISYYGRLVQYLGRVGRGNQECLAIDFLDYKQAMLNSTYKKRVEGYKQMHYI